MSRRNVVLRDLERTLDRAEMNSVHGGQSDAILLMQTASVEHADFSEVTVSVAGLNPAGGSGLSLATLNPLTQHASLTASPLTALQTRPAATLRLGISNLF